MRISVIIMVILCITSCSTTSNMQCDEMYGVDYDCDIPQKNSYAVDRHYYPNVQSLYYYPRYTRIIRPTTPPLPHSEQKNVVSKRRPSIVKTTRGSE